MARPADRGNQIKQFILTNVDQHPMDVVSVASKEFGITRQAINRYIRDLVKDGLIIAEGKTKQRKYKLKVLKYMVFELDLLDNLEEHTIWNEKLIPMLDNLPENIIDLWHYGCTEMINNAIDHSNGTKLTISIKIDAVKIHVWIHDNGVGIFKKIKEECNLEDERHAVLELSKGKLTTDPNNHTGEGIFFSSRMFDSYVIISGDVHFSHHSDDGEEDWIWESDQSEKGTHILMSLENDSARVWSDVFNKYSAKGSDYGFTKTVVPIRLAKHGLEKLISRSQAKRVMARVDRFKTVFLDFRDVETIGQAFADEIFRVFSRNHPEIKIYPVNENNNIKNMIKRVKSSD